MSLELLDEDTPRVRSYVQYDEHGRARLDAEIESRARGHRADLTATKREKKHKPLRVILDIDSVRGLSASKKRATVSCALAPGPRARASEHGFASHECAPVQYAYERQRQQATTSGRASSRDETDIKATFSFYVTQASVDDVITIEVREGLESPRGKLGNAKATCEIPVRALTPNREPPVWTATTDVARVPERYGEFRYAMYFDHEREGVLHVLVSGSTGIKASDMSGQSDPYVRAKLVRVNESVAVKKAFELAAYDQGLKLRAAKSSHQTSVQKQTLDPVWDEEFEFERVDRNSESYVLFRLYDRDLVGEDDELGQYAVHVRDLKAARSTDPGAQIKTVQWRNASHNKLECVGKLNIVAYWEDAGRTDLRVNMKRAVGLPSCDPFGSSNSYITVEMTGNYEPERHRTSICRGTTSPEWEHWMSFLSTSRQQCRNLNEETLTLRVYVLDSKKEKSKFLGKSQLPLRRVLTKAKGGAKMSFWLPLVEENTAVNVVDIRLSAYLESDSPARRPTDHPVSLRDQKNYDATYARGLRLVQEREKSIAARELEEELAYYSQLSKTIEIRLREFKWPEYLIPAYSKAYAACCNNPELLPPPPDGMELPNDIVRIFTAAAFARVKRESSTHRS